MASLICQISISDNFQIGLSNTKLTICVPKSSDLCLASICSKSLRKTWVFWSKLWNLFPARAHQRQKPVGSRFTICQRSSSVKEQFRVKDGDDHGAQKSSSQGVNQTAAKMSICFTIYWHWTCVYTLYLHLCEQIQRRNSSWKREGICAKYPIALQECWAMRWRNIMAACSLVI